MIKEADHKLELLAIFKGVPFICQAIIQEIDEERGTVQINCQDPAMVCLLQTPEIRILGSDYFEPSMAQVASVDIQSGDVLLDNFFYLGINLGERMIVRVEPKAPINVTIENEGQETIGQLVDISLNGIGLQVDHSSYSPALKPGTIIQTSMDLPNSSLSIEGTVLSAAKMDEFYRLSIRFNQYGSQKADIFKYLTDRRAEIENELIQEYKKAGDANATIPK